MERYRCSHLGRAPCTHGCYRGCRRLGATRQRTDRRDVGLRHAARQRMIAAARHQDQVRQGRQFRDQLAHHIAQPRAQVDALQCRHEPAPRDKWTLRRINHNK